MNYLAVFVAAVVVFIIGYLWYSPFLFGNLWMKLSNISIKDVNKSKKKGKYLNLLGGCLKYKSWALQR